MPRLPWALTVIASCTLLAWACSAMLVPAIARSTGDAADYRLTFENGEAPWPDASRAYGIELYVDGQSTSRAAFSLFASHTVVGYPPDLRSADGAPEAVERDTGTVSFRGRSATLCIRRGETPATLRVRRDGETVRIVELPAKQAGKWRYWVDLPQDTPTGIGWFVALLAGFGLVAFRLRPWAGGERRAVVWLLGHTTVYQLVHWLANPVGTTNDSFGYLRSAVRLTEFKASYYPPGYPLVIGSLLPTGRDLAAAVTLLQAGLAVLAAYWLYRIVRRTFDVLPSVVAVLVAVSSAYYPMMSRSVMTESLTSWAMIGSVYFVLEQRRTGRPLHGLAAGALAAFAASLRITPLVVLLPLLFLAHVQRPLRRAWTRAAVPIGTALAPILVAALVLGGTGSGSLSLATSLGSHLYNSVVTAKGIYDEDGPVSKRYADVVLGDWNSIGGQRSAMRRLRVDHGLSYSEAQTVLLDISFEALRDQPFRFVVEFVKQSVGQLFRPPRMVSRATMAEPVEQLLTPPILGVSASGREWRQGIEVFERTAWPVLCVSFLLACLAAVFLPHGLALLLLAGIVLGNITIASATEFPIDRYSVPAAPALIALAVGMPLHLLARRKARAAGAAADPGRDGLPAAEPEGVA